MSGVQQPIKGLCFDKDGTLFDFTATWSAWAQAFLRRAAGGDDAFAARMGEAIGFDLNAGRFAPSSIAIAGTAAECAAVLAPYLPALSLDDILAMSNEEASRAPQVEVVPLIPLLRQFRARGLSLGIATNDSEAPAHEHLAAAGITDMVDFVAGYDSGYGGKPEAGQLLAFAAAVDLPPEQIIMVGDSTHDLSAGHAARMRTIAVLTGIATADTLAPLADVVLRDIGEIPAWLTAQGVA